MYKMNYYRKSIADNANEEQKYEYFGTGESFRLRKNALHYLYDIVQSEYKEKGYTTEARVGSLYCYKSEKTAEGDRKVIEKLIKVEK